MIVVALIKVPIVGVVTSAVPQFIEFACNVLKMLKGIEEKEVEIGETKISKMPKEAKECDEVGEVNLIPEFGEEQKSSQQRNSSNEASINNSSRR